MLEQKQSRYGKRGIREQAPSARYAHTVACIRNVLPLLWIRRVFCEQKCLSLRLT
jgi:hypothetical protein